MRAYLLLSFVAALCISETLAATNCTTKGEISCYSCMGRDMENCQSGLTCCKGACFKLEDIKHNVIVKGCVNNREEDASMKVRELNVPLYWANKEKVKGESFFCTGKDFCNETSRASLFASVFSMILAALIIR
ncbi:hypothetical protein CAEBREN_13970 [Caenorhabditis brenneri]|uniref:Uncharacterized protein n=1 Tax=Caenorhabditis brenneri TaxID=135651 RepID=G0NTW8_CAEBE|nr:hypothetical protein CAEBREN_13970 [Caenorhabditis brenneri]